MSLVNEALKKARLEAARQDAARRGLPLPGAQSPRRRQIAGPSLVKVGLVALLVAVAALLFFAGRFTSSSAPSPAEVQVAEAPRPTPPVPAEAEASAAPGAAEASAPVERPAAPAAAVRPSTGPPASNDSRPPAATAPRPAPADPPAERPLDRASRVRVRTQLDEPPSAAQQPGVSSAAPAARPPSAATPPKEAIQTKIRTLELPGSRRIELGGIAWSEDRPFALINGRVVGPGDTIESLTVVNIEQRAVELEGDAGRFLLRLK